MAYPKTAPDTDFNPCRFWMTITGICLVIITGSIFVSRSYQGRRNHEAKDYRPPHLKKLEVDLQAVNYDGNEVNLGQLKGKVWVMGYMYTDCPSGCLGLAEYLKQLNKEIDAPDDLQLVSISLNPKEDTPEKITKWVKEHGVDLPNWWFLTGEEVKIRDYMRDWFGMVPGEQSEDPAVVAAQGKFQHEPMLALVDAGGNIRGYYRVMQFDIGELDFKRMVIETKMVMEEQQWETDGDTEEKVAEKAEDKAEDKAEETTP